jgi:hypothetical protein
MQVEVYVGDSGYFAVVPKGGSAKLPIDKGPWGKQKDLNLERDDGPRAGLDTVKCCQDIELQGYHIADIKYGPTGIS